MQEILKYLRKIFPEQYSRVGKLARLRFEPSGTIESRILIAGSEHGDKPFGTAAMIQAMGELNAKSLEHTLIDFVPVIDIKGHPDKRTIMGDAGFGKPSYLDNGYFSDKMPAEIKDLVSMLHGYDMAIQLTASFREEAPLINGYYVMPQVSSEMCDGKRKTRISPVSNDLSGSIVNSLKRKGIKLLDKSMNGRLGDGHALFRPGIVIQGVENNGEIECRTRNAFLLKCLQNGMEAIISVAIADKFSSAPKNQVVDAHKAAIDAVVAFYEKAPQRK